MCCIEIELFLTCMILLYLYAPYLLGSNIIARIVNNNIHAERSNGGEVHSYIHGALAFTIYYMYAKKYDF